MPVIPGARGTRRRLSAMRARIKNRRVTWWDAAFLAAAGVVGGLTGSIAGLASIATYPALLLVGLPPVTANVTNTVALVFNGVRLGVGFTARARGPRRLAETDCSRRRGRWRDRRRAAVDHTGGGLREDRAGPARARFGRDRDSADGHQDPIVADHRRHTTTVLVESFAIFLICIYGGYFGAAAGVLMLALLLRAGNATLAHANAAKNVIARCRERCCRPDIRRSLPRCTGRPSLRSASGAWSGRGWVQSWCATPPLDHCAWRSAPRAWRSRSNSESTPTASPARMDCRPWRLGFPSRSGSGH